MDKTIIKLSIKPNLDIDFSWVPAGEFMMGTAENEQWHEQEESPKHLVSFDKGFYIGKYSVTAEQWNAIMADSRQFENLNTPVVMVDWYQARDFAEKLTARIDGWKFSLPTEAQWEYACRAGSDTLFSNGNTEEDLAKTAWYVANSGGRAHCVGGKEPNKWGLYDMIGNVFEWCNDWEGGYSSQPQNSPTGAAGGEKKILRGGCFKCPPQFCRSANRYSALPDNKNTNIGFRLVAIRQP